LPALPQGRDASIDARTLAPWIHKYASQYGVDPQVMGAVVAQESSFINHGVHRDGTGHGLVGLDDNGLLRDFEKWSGTRVGRGQRANTIAPEKQIEFLAKTLARFTQKLGGDEWAAVRAWHAGMRGRNRSNGVAYEQLIRARIPQIATAIPPTWSGALPRDEMLAARPRGPLTLEVAEGTTPVSGPGVDYENA
jgi:soluble lytic murein transglycosylase-like protein